MDEFVEKRPKTSFYRGCLMTFIRQIRVNFNFGYLDCVRYGGDFVIPGFFVSRSYSIHFTVTLPGMENIVRQD